MEANKCLFVYPIYFDADRSVSEGRRVPKSLAKKNPHVNDILHAITQKIGLAAEIEKDKSHPKSFTGTGRIRVFNVSESKNQLLLNIAAVIPVTSSNKSDNSSNASATTSSPSATLNSTNSVQLAPNLVYQVRSKKKKNQK